MVHLHKRYEESFISGFNSLTPTGAAQSSLNGMPAEYKIVSSFAPAGRSQRLSFKAK